MQSATRQGMKPIYASTLARRDRQVLEEQGRGYDSGDRILRQHAACRKVIGILRCMDRFYTTLWVNEAEHPMI